MILEKKVNGQVLSVVPGRWSRSRTLDTPKIPDRHPGGKMSRSRNVAWALRINICNENYQNLPPPLRLCGAYRGRYGVLRGWSSFRALLSRALTSTSPYFYRYIRGCRMYARHGVPCKWIKYISRLLKLSGSTIRESVYRIKDRQEDVHYGDRMRVG